MKSEAARAVFGHSERLLAGWVYCADNEGEAAARPAARRAATQVGAYVVKQPALSAGTVSPLCGWTAFHRQKAIVIVMENGARVKLQAAYRWCSCLEARISDMHCMSDDS